ncbi:MAG: hypothetical protein EA411_03905 [Saprospirales bacterium]|nr:MAG: hypothetical protein EA411_03905 [Saprospirales bacterium]
MEGTHRKIRKRLLSSSDIRSLPGLRGQWADVVRRSGPYGSEFNPVVVFHTGFHPYVTERFIEHLHLLDRTNGKLIMKVLDMSQYVDDDGNTRKLHQQTRRFFTNFKTILPRYILLFDAGTDWLDSLLVQFAKELHKKGIDPLYPLILAPVCKKNRCESTLYGQLFSINDSIGTLFISGNHLLCGRFDPKDQVEEYYGGELATWLG